MLENASIISILYGLYTYFKKKAPHENAGEKPSFVTRLENAHYNLDNLPKAFCDSITYDPMHNPEMIDIAPDHVIDKKQIEPLKGINPFNDQPMTPLLNSASVPAQRKQLLSLQGQLLLGFSDLIL